MRQINPVSVHVVSKSEGVHGPEHVGWACVGGLWSGLSPCFVTPRGVPAPAHGPLGRTVLLCTPVTGGGNMLSLSEADSVFLSNVLI